jgi:uncharacterized protein YutD
MISKHLLQQQRTVRNLTAFVPRVIKQVSSKDSERHKAHRKTGLYKEFTDELVPLSQFCSYRYPKSYMVGYSCDNRPFDASIHTSNGQFVENIEIAFPQNGHVQAKVNKKVVDAGWASGDWVSPGEQIVRLRGPFKETAKKKSGKNYPDTVLVFVAEYLPLFSAHFGIGMCRRDDLVRILKGFSFNAKEVFLLDVPSKLIVRIQP